MKQYSTNAYYNYARRLLENDNSDSTETIKAGDSHVGKLIVGASAGAAGAVACLKYLDDTFSISSLTTATTKLSDIAKEAAIDGTGIFKRILGKLSGMVGTALGWVQKACSGILEKFPSLNKPILGSGSATYGSVFCMALAAAAVGAVLYKIYKFIKNKRKKTESVAMYNFRKNYELSIMLDETTMFFNRLDMLIEANPHEEFRKKLAAEKAVKANIHNAIDKTDQSFGAAMRQNQAKAQAIQGKSNAIYNAIDKTDQSFGAAMRQNQTKANAIAQGKANAIYNSIDKADQSVGAAMRQNQLDARQNNLATAGMRAKGLDPAQVKAAQDQIVANNRYRTTPTLWGQAKDKAFRAMGGKYSKPVDPNDIRFMNPKDMSPELAKQLKQLQRTPEVVNTKYIQQANGKVLAIGTDQFGNQVSMDTMARTAVPKGQPVVNSPRLAQVAAQRAGIDAGETGRIAHLDAIQDIKDKYAMAKRNAKYGTSDPNLDRMKSTSVSQSTVDKIHSAQDARSRAAAAQVDADDANVGTSLFRKTTTPPKAQVAKITSRTLKNGQELVTKFDKYGNEISSEVMDSAKSPAKAIGNSPAKAETFIESMQGKANTMWETSKQWCKDNPRLITIVAIIAALIACWVGVKKYKDSKAKKQAGQQTAAATA